MGVWVQGAGMAEAASTPPVVAGYTRLKDEGKAPAAELGQVLLGELNCAQCHAAPDAKRILTKGAPDLSGIGARATAGWLRNYLSKPHEVKPGATMPDVFHASEAKSRDGAVDFLVNYLVSLGGPIKPAEEEGAAALVESGRKLFSTVGCVACHAPEKAGVTKVPSVPIPDQASKTTIDRLEAFLLNPLKERPGSRMPVVGLSPDEARAISVYLLRDQLNNPQAKEMAQAKVHGVKFEYFEAHVPNVSPRGFVGLTAKMTGHLDHFSLNFSGHRNDEYAVRYTASLVVPADGEYTFYATSDDGSRVNVGGRAVVNNDGDHAAIEKSGKAKLTKGEHPITVTYMQRGGDGVLKVEWSGPNLPRQEIGREALLRVGGAPMVPLNSEAFTPDAQKVEMGGRMFSMLGCASCHTLPNQKSAQTGKPLASVNVDNDNGCIGAHPDKTAPGYDLSDEQRAALKAAIKDQAGLNKAFEPADRVIATMAAMNCLACHTREGVGGPPSDRGELFVMTSEFDMGDEGRIPPKLDHVGMKLLASAMEQIIFEGKLHIRPVLATRMPVWGKAALGEIVEAFQKADAVKETELAQPPFDEKVVRDGWQLVGLRGLACINCHGMNGQKSLGMPGPDLGTVHDRIKYGFFKPFLDNPAALVPGTRMPQFWSGHEAAYKDVAGGTEEGQVSAIWAYLSLGQNMPLPAGMGRSGGFELIPADGPIVHRTFMAGVGPRAVLVGFPERVHVAFDANGVRMAKAWRGKFFDAAGAWEGRGGNWLGPLGVDVIDLPAGPSFAFLQSPGADWPKIIEPVKSPAEETYRNVGGHFKGYELDKQERPTFHYVLKDVDIHEQPVPVLLATTSELIRKFKVEAKGPVKDLYFLAGQGATIEQKGPGTWVVDGKMTLKLDLPAGLAPVVREVEGGKQLLVPVQLTNGSASFDVEMSW
jgi:mono/diheme cytochrome c family protein